MWRTGLVAPRHVGSSRTRARTPVPCIGRQLLNHCATREALNNLLLHLKELEKEGQIKPKVSRGDEIKIRAEINEIETLKKEKINETKNWFFEKINKIDKQFFIYFGYISSDLFVF